MSGISFAFAIGKIAAATDTKDSIRHTAIILRVLSFIIKSTPFYVGSAKKHFY